MLETARRYRKRKESPVEETRRLLDAIKRDTLNSFITIDEQGALLSARSAEDLLDREDAGVLAGIPVAVKDNICTCGVRTTCASEILADFVPAYDATVVKKLKDQGAVILGKTNLDEFAMGSTTTTSCFGPTRNPWDPSRTREDPAEDRRRRWRPCCAPALWAPTRAGLSACRQASAELPG